MDNKIHIALLGGQPMPVYLGIKYANAQKLLLVHSNSSLHLAERIRAEFDSSVEFIEIDPVDISKIESATKKLCEKYKDCEISVNISGGTKPWAYFFSLIFGQLPNATLFYVDQNCYVWNLKTKEKKYINFDIEAQFRLLGNPLEKYTNFSEYTDGDFACIKQIEKAREINHKDFNSLLSVFPNNEKESWKKRLKNQAEDKFVLQSGSFVEFTKPNLVSICIMHKKRGPVIQQVKSPHAVQLCFNTNWFEVKVGKILIKWKRTKAIYHNCIFPYKNLDKNEVDLVVNTGNKLLFVECKTQINQITDIDKFHTVVRNYGGQGSKGLFVTDAKFSDMALQKCSDLGIISFSLSDANLNMDSATALYLKLESELFNINPK